MGRNIIFILILTILSISTYAQTEPSQATNLTFVGVKAYGVSIKITASGADGYLILRSNADIVDVPIDDIPYGVGEWIGNAKVIAAGTWKNLYHVRESVANTEYHFAVFAYNVSGSDVNYNTVALKGSETTKGLDFDGYYDNFRIDVLDAVDDLSNLLYSHDHLAYGDYYDKLVENIYEKDTANGHYVVCEYSNNIYQYTTDDYNYSTFNREHVTPKSWMPSDPDSYDFEGSDYHNLFNVKASVNSKRSNRTMAEVVETSPWTDMDCKYGEDQYNDDAFEPKESIKGNVARAMFYQLVTYDGLSGSWSFNDLDTYGNQQDVVQLKQWHQIDPVDNFEIARNEFIYYEQKNRNPFIDHPEWVKCIDFKTLELNGTCPLDTGLVDDVSIFNKNKDINLTIYPNPIRNKGFIKTDYSDKIVLIELLNIKAQKQAIEYNVKENVVNFNIDNGLNGIFFLKIYTDNNVYIKKIEINNLQ